MSEHGERTEVPPASAPTAEVPGTGAGTPLATAPTDSDTDTAAGVGPATTTPDAAEVPVDPVRRDLAQVAEAMASARAGVPAPVDVPEVPGDDEVAGLEQAHEALRSTLDRVDRGG